LQHKRSAAQRNATQRINATQRLQNATERNVQKKQMEQNKCKTKRIRNKSEIKRSGRERSEVKNATLRNQYKMKRSESETNLIETQRNAANPRINATNEK